MKLKDYFAFTRGEKRGALVLISIIFVLIILQFIPYSFNNFNQPDFSAFENKINAFEKQLKDHKKSKKNNFTLFEFNPNTISDKAWKKLGFDDWQIKNINKYKQKGGNWQTKNDVAKIYGLDSLHFIQLKPYILLPDKKTTNNYVPDKKKQPTYFDFNPNTISDKAWKKLGFDDWQIKNINKYKQKGGKWKTKNDVAEIYGLDEEEFKKLQPHILLPDIIDKKSSTKELLKININTANAEELTNLKGINSEKYAAIIIKYRTQLGGFIKKEQLLEVWNMKEETYNNFLPQLILNNNTPKQININTADVETLKNHPYINWNIANAIIKYKKAHNNYTSLDELKKIHLITDDIYIKIAPYLKIN